MKILDAKFEIGLGDGGVAVVHFAFRLGALETIYVTGPGLDRRFAPKVVNRTPRACATHAIEAVRLAQRGTRATKGT